MSVLKFDRSESKAEYLNTANKIYIQTIQFLSKLSSRYSRLLADEVAELASDLVAEVEKANSIYPGTDLRDGLREQHMLEARGALMALDVHLKHCYDIMMLNPEGCFSTSSGNPVKSAEAKKKLGNMAQNLGELIDLENAMLTSLIKSDRDRARKEQKKQEKEQAEDKPNDQADATQ